MHKRSTRPQSLARVFALVAVFASSGATCNRQWLQPFGPAAPQAPVVLAPNADIQAIAAAVNSNSQRVQSLAADYATITIPDATGIPPLRGTIALERPGRFRLIAGTGITGQEIDLGSNDELFWVWVRRNQPPAVHICRHDQFAGSAASQVMPIEPHWLHSALGLVQIDPAAVHQPPFPRGDGTVELRTSLPSAAGTLVRVLVVDATRATVREQHVYDPTGTTLLASAVAHAHRYYPAEQVVLPERVTVRLPTAQVAMVLDLGAVRINQLGGEGQQLWALPAFEGVPQIDLGTVPAGLPPLGGQATESTPRRSVYAASAVRGGTSRAASLAPPATGHVPERPRVLSRVRALPILQKMRGGSSSEQQGSEVQPAGYQTETR